MSGLFGASCKGDCSDVLYYGADYHSHLGTEFGGVATFDDKLHRKIHDISSSQFKSKFFEDLGRMPGRMGIGAVSAREEQPICLVSKFGPFAICMDGLVENAEELAAELRGQGVSFSEISSGGPGEIVFMTPDALRDLRPSGQACQICAFLWIYTGFPASDYEGIDVEVVRG